MNIYSLRVKCKHPTGKNIEYAALLAHAFPLVVPKSHLNYESRNRANVPMDMQFAVQLYESPAINALANYLITQSEIDYNYLNFTPNPTQERINAAAVTKYSTMNRLSTDDVAALNAKTTIDPTTDLVFKSQATQA